MGTELKFSGHTSPSLMGFPRTTMMDTLRCSSPRNVNTDSYHKSVVS